MEIRIIVAEPWDFTSSDGDNLLRVKIIEKREANFIAIALSTYSIVSKYLILKKRDEYGNYNIYSTDDVDCEEVKFSMIGKIVNNDPE